MYWRQTYPLYKLYSISLFCSGWRRLFTTPAACKGSSFSDGHSTEAENTVKLSNNNTPESCPMLYICIEDYVCLQLWFQCIILCSFMYEIPWGQLYLSLKKMCYWNVPQCMILAQFRLWDPLRPMQHFLTLLALLHCCKAEGHIPLNRAMAGPYQRLTTFVSDSFCCLEPHIPTHLSSSTSMTHSKGVLSLAGISSVRWKMSMWSGMGISLSAIVESKVDFPKQAQNDDIVQWVHIAMDSWTKVDCWINMFDGSPWDPLNALGIFECFITQNLMCSGISIDSWTNYLYPLTNSTHEMRPSL